MNAFKEAAKKKKAAAGGKGSTTKAFTATAKEVVEIPQKQEPEETIIEKTNAAESSEVKGRAGEIGALLEGIVGEKRPVKKSATLYLSTDNLNELKKRAKKAGASSSEYLDILLSKLFEEG